MEVFAGSADEQEHRGRELRARRALGLLLAFVAFTQFLPSEPFLTQFLASKGLTKEQVDHDLFSLWIYARLPLLLVVGALAECVGSVNVLLLGAMCGCFTVAVTRFSTWMPALQATQLTVAASLAAHAGPQYAVLFEVSAALGSDYQKHVHWVMAALLCSNCAAGAVGNAMLSAGLPYQRIWELSLAAQVASLVVAAELAREVRGLLRPRPRGGIGRPWRDACASFCLPGVADWTLWAVTMHTAHVLVATFWQLLLRAKAPQAEHLNGYVSAASYLLGGLGLLLSARAPVMSNRGARGWLIGSSVAASGLLLCFMGVAVGPLEFYFAFVIYQLVFRLSAAAATQQVGAEIREVAGRGAAPGEGSWGGSKSFAQAWLQAGPLGCAPAPAGAAPPRLGSVALVINATQALASCVQAAVQMAFERAQGQSYSGRLPMATRFELLGLGLCLTCVLFLGCRATGAVRGCRR